MILVIGATGQLGSDIVQRLSEHGRRVRAFVREGSTHADLRALPGVEIAIGDLQDLDSIDRAVKGATHIVATANTVAPRKGDRRAEILDRGYGHLITAAEREGVEQFVLVSIPPTEGQEAAPEFRFKQLNEQRLIDSSIPHTILRFPMFTEVWLSLSGSSIPERGEPRSTLQRPSSFLQRFRKITGHLVEDHGRLLVNGSAHNRQAFISVHDAATITAAAVGHTSALGQILEIGGPEILDWNDVAQLWSRLLDRDVKVTVTPKTVFRINQVLMRPFSADASNIMGLNAVGA
ncbi:MAG: NmrA family NAD(P)-binding protein, partial [Nitriliruptorales bacterium]|nr:NmrA family NAD(P)-binding protein [Nitriliruptorales bacterium]